MKKVGVIGNSHIAAMRLGWKAIWAQYPDVELVFFGKPLVTRDEIELAENRLIAANDEVAEKFQRASGNTELSGECDGYVLCDLGITSRVPIDFCRAYRPEGYALDTGIPVSQPCFHAALNGIFGDSFAVSLVNQLRILTDAPIALIPAPMRSTDHPDPDRKRLEENGDATKIADAFNEALRKLADDLNLRLFLQTGTTLASPLRTKQVYTRAHVRVQRHEASTRGASEDDAADADEIVPPAVAPEELATIDKDYGHMNARYGAVMLRLVLDNFGFYPRAVADATSATPADSIPEPFSIPAERLSDYPAPLLTRVIGRVKRLIGRGA